MMAARPHAVHLHLRDLLDGLVQVSDRDDCEVRGLAVDSRGVRAGDVFFACAGRRSHGLAFLKQAIAAGSVAVVYEVRDAHEVRVLRERYAVPSGPRRVPLVAVPALSRHLGAIADRFFAHPSRDLTVVGITGTNGKTSCSHFLAQSLNGLGGRCEVIGTLGVGAMGHLEPVAHTTPDAVTVHRLLAEMRARGAGAVAMEVSSHGLHQGRVAGVRFDTALFTNLTRDHLDYHGDMRTYGRAKRLLFEAAGLRRAVLNLRDAFGQEILDSLSPEVQATGYYLDAGAPEPGAQHLLPTHIPLVIGSDLQLHRAGISLRVETPSGSGRIDAALLGRFNAENVLATLAVLVSMEVPLDAALARVRALNTVPGRMEAFGAGPGQPLVVVDYAHTPDALEQALVSLRAHCEGELWCVFGCGGERDPGKRPLMGAVAEGLADRLVITNDNPRNESPTDIVINIQQGMQDPDRP
ncbi:MAG: Mur ligase family protein, partial [Gammaproteobacteria bacterium]